MIDWEDLTWEDIDREHRYGVQQILGNHFDTKSLMSHLVESVSTAIPVQLETCIVKALNGRVEELKKRCPDKKNPRDFSRNFFEVYVNDKLAIKKCILADEILQKEFENLLAAYAEVLSDAVWQSYDFFVNYGEGPGKI